MSSGKRPVKKSNYKEPKTKPQPVIGKQKAKWIDRKREGFIDDLTEKEINPDAKEDFDKVLKGLIELPPEEWENDKD